MTGFYAPYLFTGGGSWLKHHLLLVDAAGKLASIYPFEGEIERTTACSGILIPSFPASVATSPEDALVWIIEALSREEGITLKALLERLFPRSEMEIGQPVVLWNLENVHPDACFLERESYIKQLYP